MTTEIAKADLAEMKKPTKSTTPDVSKTDPIQKQAEMDAPTASKPEVEEPTKNLEPKTCASSTPEESKEKG